MGKLSTSKLLLFIVCVVSFVLLTVVVLAWVIWDKTDATGLAGVVISPSVAVIGFYTWKAKAENMIKLGFTKDEVLNGLDDDT